MRDPQVGDRRRVGLAGLALVAGLVGSAAAPARAGEAAPENFAGRLEFEAKSEFSQVRIRRRGEVRSLIFVRDNGEEALESRVDLRRPWDLQFEYLKFLFASYLVRDPQPNVLIIGLGGGGMVHFLRRSDPAVQIDAVEIDPLIVRLADEYFGVRSGENVRVITADGLKFIAEPPETKAYDVIYMDAFLKPSAETDATGVPLALRTRQFYEQLQKKLKPGGVVAFNINPHEQMDEDVRAIAEAFPQVYQFPLSGGTGVVAVASTDPVRVPRPEMMKRARALDERFTTAISFTEMARRVRE
jgi:spermidine synthase